MRTDNIAMNDNVQYHADAVCHYISTWCHAAGPTLIDRAHWIQKPNMST